MPTAIVTGATGLSPHLPSVYQKNNPSHTPQGINGLALVRTLSADPKTWTQIHAVSRSAPSASTLFPANVQHLPLDLLGGVADIAKTLKQKINELSNDAIYVFFAAYLEQDTEEKLSDVNGALLRNFLEGVRQAELEKRLKRVVLTTGAKYYGGRFSQIFFAVLCCAAVFFLSEVVVLDELI